MTTDIMISELTQTVSDLQKDMDILKENNNYLYEKLDKAYGDKIVLRSENYKLKEQVNGTYDKKVSYGPEKEEEECITCSA